MRSELMQEVIDMLDDCVNALANYRLLQKRANTVADPIGAQVTSEHITELKKLINKLENK